VKQAFSGRKTYPDPSFGLLQTTPDPFNDLGAVDLPKTKTVFYKQHPLGAEITVHAVIDGLVALLQEIQDSDDLEPYNAQKLWFHQLCRRVQKFVPTSLECGDYFAPLGLLWVELLHHSNLLGESEYQHWVEADVRMVFEEEWLKVMVPEGQNLVGMAIQRAQESHKVFGQGMYGFFLNVCYQLQIMRGRQGFSVPTSQDTADLLGVKGRSISLYIDRAVREGFLKCISASYKPGSHARTYRFIEDPSR
jgi:hypothetical protein